MSRCCGGDVKCEMHLRYSKIQTLSLTLTNIQQDVQTGYHGIVCSSILNYLTTKLNHNALLLCHIHTNKSNVIRMYLEHKRIIDCSRFMCWGNNQSIANEWNIKNLLLLSRESFSVVWIWCGKYSQFGAKILTAQSFPATDSLMLAPHSHWWFIYTQQGFLLESEV